METKEWQDRSKGTKGATPTKETKQIPIIMEAGEGMNRILLFSGRKKDWELWSTKFMIVAAEKGYKDILLGTRAVPSDAAIQALPAPNAAGITAAQLAQHETKTANAKAFTMLSQCMTDQIGMRAITNAMTATHENGHAGIAWKNLRARYESNTAYEAKG